MELQCNKDNTDFDDKLYELIDQIGRQAYINTVAIQTILNILLDKKFFSTDEYNENKKCIEETNSKLKPHNLKNNLEEFRKVCNKLKMQDELLEKFLSGNYTTEELELIYKDL